MSAPDREGCRSKVPKGVRMGPPDRNGIFDLDGTLINSRPDIHDGIRHVFALKVRPGWCPTSIATAPLRPILIARNIAHSREL